MVSRRFQFAVAGGAVLGLAVVGSFGPLVRNRAGAAAGHYGATVDIEAVLPTWSGVRLRGVDVTLAEVPSTRIHVDELVVSYGWSSRRVELRGGRVAATGAYRAVLGELEAWRDAHRAKGGGESGGGAGAGRAIDVSGLDVEWQDTAEGPSQSVRAKDVQLERGRSHLRRARRPGIRPRAGVGAGGTVLVKSDGGYRLAELGARADAALSCRPRTGLPAAVDADDPPVPADVPDDMAQGSRRGAGRGRPRAKPAAAASPTAPAARNDAPSGGDAGAGDLGGRALVARTLLVEAARAVDAVVDPSARIRLDAVRARVRRGEDTLNLGPGSLKVERGDKALVVELAPGGGREGAPAPAGPARVAGGDVDSPGGAADPRAGKSAPGLPQALTFRLTIPFDRPEDPAGEVTADVRGGPIWLSTIGVQDGDFGLLEVARTSLETHARVVLSADARQLSFDGEGKVHRLSVRSKALSEEPVMGLELAWRGKVAAALDGSRLQVDGGEIDVGSTQLFVEGDYQRAGESRRVNARFEVPLSPCQSMLDSAPRGLAPKLAGMRMAGSFALKGHARFDSANLDRDYDVRWDASNSCRVVEVPSDVDVERFRHPFRRTAYTPENEAVEIELGPETDGWLSLAHISRFMEVAVQTTEDGGFFRHRGFDEEAIRNSIRENLRSGRFVRGASTISMQTAKNVYLDRGKNLSRKLQEAVLTMYLEQELTKEQILELYLNVIEFGPMVYGIGPAARYYFNVPAAELSLSQSLYLSSILPSPKKQHFGAGGAVTPQWASYLHKLMTIAHKRGRITEDELELGLRETPVRGAQVPHRSASDDSLPGDEDAASRLGP
ncbi:MAG: biosynthetic peptidoglycan transglycosylase [Polyangiaceae bacterium]